MAKKIKAILKLQIQGGKATPAPPIGPVLAVQKVNIADFCSRFNEATQQLVGFKVPVVVTVFEDGSYTFRLKQPLTADLLKKAAGIEKGSGEPNRKKVAKITKAQLQDIAQKKMADLNTDGIEQAMKIVEGTARNMGITVE